MDWPSGPARAEALARFLKMSPGSSPEELLVAVRKGFPFRAFTAVTRHLGATPQRVTVVLGIPSRTVARRKKSGHFTPQESDRLFRLANVLAQAVETLGSDVKAQRWMAEPNTALGGAAPLDLLDTDIGARQVEDTLLRIDHGMFS